MAFLIAALVVIVIAVILGALAEYMDDAMQYDLGEEDEP